MILQEESYSNVENFVFLKYIFTLLKVFKKFKMFAQLFPSIWFNPGWWTYINPSKIALFWPLAKILTWESAGGRISTFCMSDVFVWFSRLTSLICCLLLPSLVLFVNAIIQVENIKWTWISLFEFRRTELCLILQRSMSKATIPSSIKKRLDLVKRVKCKYLKRVSFHI